jgi:hypothetical protein
VTVVTDNFNRANETPLSDGGKWSIITGQSDWEVISLAAQPHVIGSDSFAVWTGDSFQNDQYAQAAISVTGTVGGSTGGGLCVRAITAAKTLYWVVADHAASSNIEIGKFVAGVHTTLTPLITRAWTDLDVFRLEANGATLTLKINGATVTTRTDGSIAAGGPGLAYSSTETAVTARTWEGGDLSAPAVSVLAPHQQFVGAAGGFCR